MLTSKKQVRKRKQRKIRNSEYYDMEKIFDDLYAQGKTDKVFNQLMEIIESEENIKLAYRNIKRNSGSSTAGVDHRTIDNLAKLSEEAYVRLIRKQFSKFDKTLKLYSLMTTKPEEVEKREKEMEAEKHEGNR